MNEKITTSPFESDEDALSFLKGNTPLGEKSEDLIREHRSAIAKVKGGRVLRQVVGINETCGIVWLSTERSTGIVMTRTHLTDDLAALTGDA